MNKPTLVRRGFLVGATLVAGAGSLVLGALPAGASSKEVSTVGSFTTYAMVHNLFPTSVNDLLPGGTTVHQTIVSTSLLCSAGRTYGPGNRVPNGSGAGKATLLAEETAPAATKGCVDFSRSSSPPRPGTVKTVSAHFDYYAYALDGVAPMLGKDAGGSRGTPKAVTLTTVKKIYECKPGFTNWHTATGGTSATINRFWPQPGSGTRTVYTDILGFTPLLVHGATGASATMTCTTPAIVTIVASGKTTQVNEENSEEGMIYYASLHSTTPIASDIYIYSSGKFASQWNTPTHYSKTHTNSLKKTATGGTANSIGNFNATTLLLAQMTNRVTAGKTAPFAQFLTQSGTFTATTNRGHFSLNTTVVNETNEWYSHMPTATAGYATSTAPVPGVRYVFNVADTLIPTYSEAKALIGFDNQTNAAGPSTLSRLCAGDLSSVIVASGFVPLNSGVTAPRTSDLAGATCREFPARSYPGFGGAKSWTFNTWVNPTG